MSTGQRRASTHVRGSPRGGAGGTLIGVFIGLVLGLGLAAGVAYYLMRANGPFPAQGGKETRESSREPSRTAKTDPAASDKPRFDFYKILPGVEEPKVQAEAKKSPDRAVVDQAKTGPDKASDKTAKAAREGRGEGAREGRLRGADRGREASGTVLAAGGLVRHRVRCREPQGAARVRRMAGEHSAGHGARQGDALPRAARPVRQHRRAEPHPQRSRAERLRRRRDQILTARLPARNRTPAKRTKNPFKHGRRADM